MKDVEVIVATNIRKKTMNMVYDRFEINDIMIVANVLNNVHDIVHDVWFNVFNKVENTKPTPEQI
jgi:hypothetical protein